MAQHSRPGESGTVLVQLDARQHGRKPRNSTPDPAAQHNERGVADSSAHLPDEKQRRAKVSKKAARGALLAGLYAGLYADTDTQVSVREVLAVVPGLTAFDVADVLGLSMVRAHPERLLSSADVDRVAAALGVEVCVLRQRVRAARTSN